MSTWWLVTDSGAKVAGPFNTYAEAAAYDPTDDRIEPCRFPDADPKRGDRP